VTVPCAAWQAELPAIRLFGMTALWRTGLCVRRHGAKANDLTGMWGSCVDSDGMRVAETDLVR